MMERSEMQKSNETGESQDTSERLSAQLKFLAVVDGLKLVERKNPIIGSSRRENSAEHSWHALLTAMVLAEHANQPIDLPRVLKMLAVHDIPEILCGDTFHYEKTNSTAELGAERNAAEKLFSELPAGQREEFFGLWSEFEQRETPESRFANAIDRMMAGLLNSNNQGGNWKTNSVTAAMALERNASIRDGSKAIWERFVEMVEQCERDGLLSK